MALKWDGKDIVRLTMSREQLDALRSSLLADARGHAKHVADIQEEERKYKESAYESGLSRVQEQALYEGFKVLILAARAEHDKIMALVQALREEDGSVKISCAS